VATPETQETLLELLRANTDEWGWLQPLLDDPDSAAIVMATVAQMARLGTAIVHNRDALTISASSAGQRGVAVITLTRTTALYGGVIPRGYRFLDERGVLARSQTDVPVSAGTITVSVPVETDRRSELVNTEDEAVFQVAPDAPVVAGVQNLIAPAGTTGNGDDTFVVASSTLITGGAANWLAVHGGERGLLQQPGEQEDEFRARVRNIADLVSPEAISALVRSIAQRTGLPPFLVGEPFQDLATPSKKAADGLYSFTAIAGTTDVPGLGGDFLDDEVTTLSDRRVARAYFEVQAGDYVSDREAQAMFLDEGFADDPMMGYLDAWLTLPPGVLAGLLSVYQHVSQAKAGGVNFDLFLQRPTVIAEMGLTTSAGDNDAWVISAPPNTAWMIVGCTVGMSSANPIPGSTCHMRFVTWDSQVIDTPERSARDTVAVKVPQIPVTVIHGRGRSDGTNFLNVVGTVWVHLIQPWP